jgi:hypothetical protein
MKPSTNGVANILKEKSADFIIAQNGKINYHFVARFAISTIIRLRHRTPGFLAWL